MNNQLTEIKGLITGKASTAKQINVLSQDLVETRQKLTLAMSSLVPEDLKDIVENESITTTLVEFDMISSKLLLSDYQIKTKKAAKKIIERLVAVWEGFVYLDGKIDTSEPHRISYRLKMKTEFD